MAVAVSGAARADLDFVLEAERLGVDSVWAAETWAYAPLAPLTYLPARTERPVTATRETIEIVRRVSSGERLVHQGRVCRLPLPDSAGRALRSAAPPVEIPIYVAALGVKNLELTGEMADGWLGNCFMPETAGAFLEPLRAGAARSGRDLAGIDLVIPAAVEFTEDEEEAARRHARGRGDLNSHPLGAEGGGPGPIVAAVVRP